MKALMTTVVKTFTGGYDNEETVAEGTALPAAEEMVTVETDASLADEPVEEQMEDSDESPETKEEIQLPADTKDGIIMEI